VAAARAGDTVRCLGRALKVGRRLGFSSVELRRKADNELLASQGETYLQSLINKNRAVAAFLPSVSFQPNFTLEQAPKGGATASPGAPSTSAAAAAASSGGYVQQGNVLRRFDEMQGMMKKLGKMQKMLGKFGGKLPGMPGMGFGR
jgi:hypothetical protein